MNSGPQRQADRNLQTRDAWERFAPHRRRVTDLLIGPGSKAAHPPLPRKLCVLGAGNCNDLDLAALGNMFGEIHLVDLDESALTFGIANQHLINPPRIVLHGNVDLLHGTIPPIVDCDVATSVCLLSQLLEQATKTLGLPPEDPKFAETLANVRREHLQQLLAATRPGGTALLVTDFVSSDTCPDLKSCTVEQLPRIVSIAFQFRNFFSGLHPGMISQALQTDPELAPLVADVTVTDPWLWDLGPRVYAVCGFIIRRST